MQVLSSYAAGQWQEGQGEGALENPTTGEIVARTSTAGIDMRAVEHARRSGARSGG